MAYHNELGEIGEKLAAEYLINKGYEILEQNFYFLKDKVTPFLLTIKSAFLPKINARLSSK